MPKKEPQPEDISSRVNALFLERKESIGAYKSAVQNLLNSVNTLFKIDDAILNLVITPKKE